MPTKKNSRNNSRNYSSSNNSTNYNSGKNKDLRALIHSGERIMYEGKPSKACYFFESVFNPMLFIALIWGAFDYFFLNQVVIRGFTEAGMKEYLLVFFVIHLMPVWMYVFGVLLMFRKYRHTYYIVTDRAIYVSGGIFVRTYNTKPFAELSHIDLHRGIFDQMFGVGDIIATSSQMTTAGSGNTWYTNTNNARPAVVRIDSIKDYDKVYRIVSKLQQDIYTDVQYPNDLRPSKNRGYKTKYSKDD